MGIVLDGSLWCNLFGWVYFKDSRWVNLFGGIDLHGSLWGGVYAGNYLGELMSMNSFVRGSFDRMTGGGYL